MPFNGRRRRRPCSAKARIILVIRTSGPSIVLLDGAKSVVSLVVHAQARSDGFAPELASVLWLSNASRRKEWRGCMATGGGYDDRAALGVLEPEDILSPRHYAAVRRGGRLMRALPLWCYTSERFHEAEKERVFLRRWNLLERAEI